MSARSRTVHAGFDWSATRPAIAVMESVAETTDTEPKNLPALYDAIDPDALGTLCRCEDDSPGGAPVHISFSYAGSKVLVGSDGEIVVGLPRFEG